MIDGFGDISHLATMSSPTPLIDQNAGPGEQMETLFAKLLLQEVRKSMPKDGLMSGPALDMFQGLFDDALAEQFAAAGGFGLGAQLSASRGISDVTPAPSGWSSPVAGHRSSTFGGRVDPITGEHRNHAGVDIAAPKGTPIQAARAGRVVFSGAKGGYGNLVIVDHGDGLESRYAHCNTLLAPVGSRVPAGAVIGTVGSTGRSTGPHLHFEIRKDGTAINPDRYLK